MREIIRYLRELIQKDEQEWLEIEENGDVECSENSVESSTTHVCG